jgi:hypothetical protein
MVSWAQRVFDQLPELPLGSVLTERLRQPVMPLDTRCFTADDARSLVGYKYVEHFQGSFLGSSQPSDRVTAAVVADGTELADVLVLIGSDHHAQAAGSVAMWAVVRDRPGARVTRRNTARHRVTAAISGPPARPT